MRTRGGVAAAATGAVAAGALGAAAFGLEGSSARVVGGLGLALVAAWAAGLSLVAARRALRPSDARGWGFVGLGCAAWCLGVVVGSGAALAGQHVPAVALIPTLAGVALVVAGLLAFAPERTEISARVRLLLDGLLLAASVFFVSWGFVLGDVWRSGNRGNVDQLLLLVGVAVSVVALTTGLLLVGSSPARRAPLAVLVAGLAAFVAAQAAGLHGALSHPPTPGPNWILYALALAFVGAGASAAGRNPAVPETGPPRVAGERSLFLPHIAVLIALVVATADHLGEGSFEPMLFWAAATALGLLIVRQFVSLREVSRLSRNLETAVLARTAELQSNERRFRSLLEHSSEVVTIADPATLRLGYVSESVFRIFGHAPEDFVGRPLVDAVHSDDRDSLLSIMAHVAERPGSVATASFRLVHRDGSWRQASATLHNLVADPAVRGMVLNVRDVTEQARLEEQLTHQAFHDSLTGLPNRALLTDRVNHSIARAARTGSRVTVLSLDLDGFKQVNDTFGHEAGDELLVAVAERLVGCMRTADTVARFGGDEFAILLADGQVANHAAHVAERILDLFRTPFLVGGRELAVGASVGLAETITGLEDASDLLRNADVAMYMAKKGGRNRFERFDPAMHAGASERLALASELRQALERRQLFIEYQPIVEMTTETVKGVEALLRWRHPTRGVIGPAQFIPLAEETGLIGSIGAWVLVEACRQVRDWQRHLPGHDDLFVSVNLSPWQVRQAEVVEQVAGVLAETGLDPAHLTLEITETVLMENSVEIVARLSALKDLGASLAIDDFGTGYSSLSYLRKFPIDTLKIDRTFVQGLGLGPEESALARAIIKLGNTFRLKTVAEGIEDAEQARILVEMGCELGQGYYFARPLDPSALRGFLEARDGRVAREAVRTA